MDDKRIIPVRVGLWTTPSSPSEEPRLLGNRCRNCGEVLFPRKQVCPNCQQKDFEDVELSRRGKIYSVTIVMQRPPVYYKGPVPYAFGYVELPDVRVETLFTDCDPESLEVGMDVELVIEKLYEDDEGNEIIAYKFRPVKAQ